MWYCVQNVLIQSFSGPYFCRIHTEYEDLQSKPLYPVRMRENTDQSNSEYGHLLRSAFLNTPLQKLKLNI